MSFGYQHALFKLKLSMQLLRRDKTCNKLDFKMLKKWSKVSSNHINLSRHSWLVSRYLYKKVSGEIYAITSYFIDKIKVNYGWNLLKQRVIGTNFNFFFVKKTLGYKLNCYFHNVVVFWDANFYIIIWKIYKKMDEYNF